MPLYTTPMVWDSDINPEGAFEKFKYTVDNVDVFVEFGQFDYQGLGFRPRRFPPVTRFCWPTAGRNQSEHWQRYVLQDCTDALRLHW